MVDLLPCPFCGSDADDINSTISGVIRCDGCGATGPFGLGVVKRERWNARVRDALEAKLAIEATGETQ